MNESTWQAQLLSLVNNLWYMALSGSFHRRCKAEGRVGAAGLPCLLILSLNSLEGVA